MRNTRLIHYSIDHSIQLDVLKIAARAGTTPEAQTNQDYVKYLSENNANITPTKRRTIQERKRVLGLGSPR